MSALLPLQPIIDQLEKAHGRPGKPRVTRPLELILCENVVFVARQARFSKRTVFTLM
jgi:hypothetical protein